MEPASALTVASPIIQRAADLAKSQLESADKLAAEDAKRYVSYLEAALTAIRGLENEYVEILVEAMHCHVDDVTQHDHLAKRIEQFLYRENLRPYLVDAVARLEQGRQALGEHADRLFQWPGTRKGREEALKAYDTLLARLKTYLHQLGGWYNNARSSDIVAFSRGTPLPMGGSGFNVPDMHRILECLSHADQERLTSLVGSLLGTSNADRHLTMTREIAGVVETMLITFR